MDEALGRSLLPGFGRADPLSDADGEARVWAGAGDRLLVRGEALGFEAVVEVFTLPDGVSQEGLERLFAAAARVGGLTHRNLAGLLLAGRVEDGRCFLMTDSPGELTLAGELKDLGPEPVRLPRALSLLAQVAHGLEGAHGAGVIHGDLRSDCVGFGPTKPQDVVVQLHGVGRLTLLEAAGLLPDGVADLVSPAYASPEQLSGGFGPGSVGAATDIYSLGVLAFRLCTGRLPFECATPELYRAAHGESAPSPPQELRPSYVPSLPRGVDGLILACLEKDPADRPAAGEVARTLAEAALEAARQARDEARAAGPLGIWKRILAKAMETARYVQYVRLGSDSMAQALAALESHEAAQKSRDQAAEEAGARWDEQHGEGQGRVHRLRRAVLALGMDRGRLVAQGAGDQPGVRDLTSQLQELLLSVAAAQAEADSGVRAATVDLTRARQASEDWDRLSANRVMELVEAVRERRDAAGDPTLHQRIDALTELVAQAGGGSVPTLSGH
jgi:Protein kinase domain